MAKRFVLAGAVCAALFATAAGAATIADKIQETDAQITLAQKQKQLMDNLGVDPILSKMPQVVSVMSFGGETKAKLMLASGVALSYGEGEVVNSRMRVVAITPREVVVAITPMEGVARPKGKKVEPVLMPLEFLAGARQNSQQGAAGGLPGVPGTPVQSGPIPPGLMQAPPPIQGGFPAVLAPAPVQAPVAAPQAPAAQAAPAAVPVSQ